MKLQWSIQSRHTQLALDNVIHLNYRNMYIWPPTKAWVQYLWSFSFGSIFDISFDLFESTHLIVRLMPEIFDILLWWVSLWLFGHHTIFNFWLLSLFPNQILVCAIGFCSSISLLIWRFTFWELFLAKTKNKEWEDI